MRDVINVHVAFDDEARVWYVTKSDVHGLRVEAAKLEQMIERVTAAVQDLLDDGDGDCTDRRDRDLKLRRRGRVRHNAP